MIPEFRADENPSSALLAEASALAPANPFYTQPYVEGWLTVALLWICAAWFLARMPARREPAVSVARQ
jgi:hypothetical protein